MADFKKMLSVERLNTPHTLKYCWGLDQTDLATGEAKLLDYGDGVSLSEVIEQIDKFCPTISETKKAIIALLQKDKLVLNEDY